MASKWGVYQDNADKSVIGLHAYAERHIRTWNELGHVAEANFHRIDDQHTCFWKAVQHAPHIA